MQTLTDRRRWNEDGSLGSDSEVPKDRLWQGMRRAIYPACPHVSVAVRDCILVPMTRRILYVEGNRDGTIGGSYFSLLFLVTGLDRSRYEPIVVFHAENALISRFRSAGIDTRVCPPGQPVTVDFPLGRWVAKAANFFKGFIMEPVQLARMLRAEKIDIVHLNNSIVTNHVWMLAALLARVACVTHERGINPSFTMRARLLARRLEAIICISGAVHANFIRAELGMLRLKTIPNGLDPRQMKVTRSPHDVCNELGVNPSSRLVGIVGNLRQWKGQEIVIRALHRLRAEHDDVVCLIIGDTDPANLRYRDQIDRLLQDLGLTERVVFTGYRSNVADYLNALEILVHASLAPEPFGRVLLEGMALRKPIVASRGGAVPEIVIDGTTGLLFTPGSDLELAARLSELLDDRSRGVAMGEAGYDRLVADFSIDRNVVDTSSLYDRIMAKKRPACA